MDSIPMMGGIKEEVWVEDEEEFNFEDFATATDTSDTSAEASIISWSNFKQELGDQNNVEMTNKPSFIGIDFEDEDDVPITPYNFDNNLTPNNYPGTSSGRVGEPANVGQGSQLLRQILDRPSRTASCDQYRGNNGCGTANDDRLFERLELSAQRAEIKSLKAIINSLKARVDARDETILHKDEIIKKQTEEISRLRNMDHYCAQFLSADPLPKLTQQQQQQQMQQQQQPPPQPPPYSSSSTTQQSSLSGGYLHDAQKCKLIQHRLVLLLHAQRCQMRENVLNLTPGQQSHCTRPYCSEMKSLLNHMSRCGQVRECTFTHCSSSFQILSHWRNCQAQDCLVCVPIKIVAKSIIEKSTNEQRASVNSKVDHHHLLPKQL